MGLTLLLFDKAANKSTPIQYVHTSVCVRVCVRVCVDLTISSWKFQRTLNSPLAVSSSYDCWFVHITGHIITFMAFFRALEYQEAVCIKVYYC